VAGPRGSLEVTIEGRATTLHPGDCAFGPRGIPHSLRAGADGPARFTLITAPGGFEAFFADYELRFPRGPEPDHERLRRVFDAHGLIPA